MIERSKVALALALALAGCASKGEGTVRPPKPVSDIYFVDGVSVPIPVEKSEIGFRAKNAMLVGQLIRNDRSKAVLVTRVEPVVETGLRATYLGHSGCHRGCPGGADASEEAMWVDRLEGQYPVELPPKMTDQMLIFRLEVDGTQGAEHLVTQCHLNVWSVILTLDDGQRVDVRFDGATDRNDWTIRAHLGEPQPEGAAPKCRDAQSINPGPSG